MLKYVVLALVLMIAVASAQCGAPPPTATAVPPSATPMPTDTPLPPSPTPLPTEIPLPPSPTTAPTDKPPPPTATPVPPTDTPVPPTPEPEAPDVADGKTLLEERCVECHDLGRVERASKSEADWRLSVVRMVNKGADLNDEELEILVLYLSETYGK